jgi:hypothetical protein
MFEDLIRSLPKLKLLSYSCSCSKDHSMLFRDIVGDDITIYCNEKRTHGVEKRNLVRERDFINIDMQ